MNFPQIMGLQEQIAADMCRESSWQVRCLKCSATRAISEEEYAQYLRHGWPKCCGYTMRLEKL